MKGLTKSYHNDSPLDRPNLGFLRHAAGLFCNHKPLMVQTSHFYEVCSSHDFRCFQSISSEKNSFSLAKHKGLNTNYRLTPVKVRTVYAKALEAVMLLVIAATTDMKNMASPIPPAEGTILKA